MAHTACTGGNCGLCGGLCTERIGIFQPLSLAEQRLVVSRARHRQVPAGSLVFREQDRAEQILVIHTGRIKLSRYSAEGKEQVIDILGPQDIYGEQQLFSGSRQGVSAIALEPSSFCEIHRGDIEALIMKHPEVGIRMLAELGTKYRRVSHLHEILSINDAKCRLASFLLMQSREEESPQLRMARENISASINLRSETISRKLKEMEREGLLDLKGHQSILIRDPEGLEQLVLAAK